MIFLEGENPTLNRFRNIFKFFYLETEYITLVSSFETPLLSVSQADFHSSNHSRRRENCHPKNQIRDSLLDESQIFQNLYKVNIYSKPIEYCSHSYTLRS